MKNKFAYIAFMASALAMGGCKAPSLTQTEKFDLPEAFIEDTDTATMASISWKEFFPDAYLVEYIDSALANNHSFLKTIENVSIARAQMKAGKGALFPEISLAIDGGIQRFGEYTMDGVGNSTTNTPDLAKDKHIPDPYKNLNLGLNFQWEADIWGKLTDKKRSAVSRWMKSVEAQRLAQTMLVGEVADMYYRLVGLDKKQYVLEEAIRKTAASYLLANELMNEGEESRLSVDQFRSRRLKLEEMLLDTEQQIAETERAFALLLGRMPFDIKRSSFEKISDYTFPVETGIPAQILHNRPDVVAAELELLACKSDASAARKAFFPSLVIGGGAGFNAFSLEKWFASPASMVYNLAAGISAPIFKRNEIRALWEEANGRQRIALLDYHETVLRSYLEVVDLITSSEQMNLRKALKEEESRIHHRSIYNANELFKTGFAGYLDVLSADERYLDCELERIELNIAYCQVHTMLYRALGGGSF